MASHQPQPFPAPPPFFKSFTTSNLEQLRKLRKSSTKEGTGLDILSLPSELRYLIPPTPPTGGEWKTFAETHHDPPQEASLEAAGIEQLYPLTEDAKLNPQPHLIALARSLLTTFLALMGVLSRDPEQFLGRVEDLQTMLYNCHDLINSFRPHQARETLIHLMESRIEMMRDEIQKIREEKEKVSVLLAGLNEGQTKEIREARMENGVQQRMGDAGESSVERQKNAWAAIEEEFDRSEAGE
jgi:mediator of RNA polymerase II transcription subunit 7